MAQILVQIKDKTKALQIELRKVPKLNRYALVVEPGETIEINTIEAGVKKNLEPIRSQRMGDDLILQLQAEEATAELQLEGFFSNCASADEGEVSRCEVPQLLLDNQPLSSLDLTQGLGSALPEQNFILSPVANESLQAATWLSSPTLTAMPLVLLGAALIVNTTNRGSSASASPVVTPPPDIPPPPPLTPVNIGLSNDTGTSSTDGITSDSTLSITGTSPGATVQYSTDGSTWSTALPAANEGSNTVFVQQIDNTGRTSTPSSFTFTLDTTAPTSTISIALASDSGASNTDGMTDNPNLVVSGTESGSLVEYSTDGSSWSTSQPTASEGLNTVFIQQIDAAGNNQTASSFTFTLDTTAPTSTLTIGLASDTGISSSDGLTSDGTVAVAGAEPGATVQYSTNGSTWATTQPTATEGVNTVFVQQVDVAGNTQAPQTLTFTLDTTAPVQTVTIQSISTDDGVSNNDFITSDNDGLLISASLSQTLGADEALQYSPDGGTTWLDITGSVSGTAVSHIDSGLIASTTIQMRVVDLAGNTGSASSQSIVIKGPTIDLNDVASSTGGFVLNGEAPGSLTGLSTTSAGDVNGDGLVDIIIGALNANTPAGFAAGRSYVVFGKTDVTPIDLSAITAGTGGFAMDAQAANDQSGLSVSRAGDINGDGLADVIVSAYFSDPAGRNLAGRSYVVFGKTDGTLINLSSVAAGTGGFVLNGENSGDQIGFPVGLAGDVNGDGLSDVILGARLSDPNGMSQAGRSYVVFGKTDTAAVEFSDVSNGVGGFVLNGEVAFDEAGNSANGAGDVNGDGLADVMVGASSHSSNGLTNSGRVYVIFGRSSTTAIDLSTIDTGTGGFVINGQTTSDYMGSWSISGAGDVNGDGLGDVIVGAVGGDPAGRNGAGRSYVVFGKTDHAAVDLSAVATGAGGFVINGESAGDTAGFSVASAGDVNGDGLTDLIIGANTSDPNGRSNAGRSYVVFGKADGTAIELSAIAASVGGFAIDGQSAGDELGRLVASAGDIDGDGLADLAVGAFFSDPAAGTDAGRGYIILSSQIMAQKFGAQLTTLGTAGNDILIGSASVDRIAAGMGDDVITANGGADILYGGAGHDTFVLNASNLSVLANMRIDGGTGRDTIEVAGGSATINLATLNNQVLKSIEAFDLTGSGNNTLTFHPTDLLQMEGEGSHNTWQSSIWGATGNTVAINSTNRQQILIDGDAGDIVSSTSSEWILASGGAVTANGQTYNVYNSSTRALQLIIDTDVAFTGVITPLVPIASSNVAAGTGGFVIDGEFSGDYSGVAVSSAGDVNGDGWADLIIGASYSSPSGQTYAGRSYVVFGKSNTAPVKLTDIAAGTGGFVINGESEFNNSGESVSSAGDVNGDGLSDLLVGAPYNSANASYAGRGYVIFGKSNTNAVDLSTIVDGTGGFAMDGENALDFSSTSLSNAGDVNGDGLSDLIVSAHYADPAGQYAAGRSYVIFGKTDTTTVDLNDIEAGNGGFVIDGEKDSDHSGWKVSDAGDVNGDGLNDLILSSRYTDGDGFQRPERSYVVFGKTDTTGVTLLDVTAQTGGFAIHCESITDLLGYSVSTAGDVNGDGLSDLIISAIGTNAGNGANSGRSYVVFGKSDTSEVFLSNITAGTGGFAMNGETEGDLSGYSVASIGDINGDGLSDLIIGAPRRFHPELGEETGRTYVVLGKTDTRTIELSLIALGTGGFALDGECNFATNGTSVSDAGDVDGDGLNDFIFGAPGHGDTGRSYVILSSQLTNSYFGAELTQLGTTGNDTLMGTGAADRIAAGAGDDVILAGGGADILYGGHGNDTFVLDTNNITNLGSSRIQGGSGFDVVRLDSSLDGVHVALTSLSHNLSLQGIEQIDMTGDSSGVMGNTLTLNLRDLLSIHDDTVSSVGGDAVQNRLLIRGDANDHVIATDGFDATPLSPEMIDGILYDVYRATNASVMDYLLVEQSMQRTIS